MENKSKKIWTIILTIYLTAVTIGCALFGYLYFSSKSKNKDNNMSTAQAQQLVNSACYDMKLIDKDPRTKTKSNKVSTKSIEEYYQDTIDEFDLQHDILQSAFYQSIALLTAKELLDNGYKQNTYYFSTTTDPFLHRAENPDESTDGGMWLASHLYTIYSISGKTLTVSLITIGGGDELPNGGYAEEGGSAYLHHIELKYITDSSYQLEYYNFDPQDDWDKAQIVGETYHDTVEYICSLADETGIYEHQYINAYTPNIQNLNDNITDAISADLWISTNYFNLKTKKYIHNASFMVDSTSNELKEADALELANTCRSKAAGLKSASFKNMQTTNNDTLLINVISNVRKFIENSNFFDYMS